MESIPEDPAPMHFLKLLALLSRNNAISLHPPNTLILGFGFTTPTLMQALDHRLAFSQVRSWEEAISHLDLYTTAARGDFPMFIVKRTTGKYFLRSKEDATKLWERLTKSRAEDVLIQPFVISKTRSAKVVEVAWDSLKGFSACLLQNCYGMDPTTPSSLLVHEDEAEVVPASTSISTQHLHDTVDLVRLIIEKTVFSDSHGKVRHLRIRLLQDIYDDWFFLGLEAVAVDRVRVRMASPEMFETTESLKRTMTPKSPLTTCSTFSGPLSPATAGRYTSHLSLQLKKTKKPVKNFRSKTLFSGSETISQNVFTYPKHYLKEQEVEAEVSKLIAEDDVKPIANMTYKSWKKRVDETKRLLLVDKIYAKTICKKRRLVMMQTSQTLRDLQKFRETIMRKTDEMIFQAEIADRVSGKIAAVGSPIDLSQYSKFSKIRQKTLDQNQRIQQTREGITRVFQDSVDKYTRMKSLIHEAKLASSKPTLVDT